VFQRIRIRLFLLSVTVIALIGLVVTSFVRHDVKTTAEQQLSSELIAIARTTAALLSATNSEPSAILNEVSRSSPTALRFVAIDRRGPETLPDTTVATFSDGQASAVAAVFSSLDHTSTTGYVVASRSTAEIDDSTSRFDRSVALAAVVGLAIAVFMTWAATTLIARSMRKLVAEARDVVRGNSKRLVAQNDNDRDELRDLRDWFNYLAADAERNNSDLASSRALLDSVLESMNQGVVALDGTGTVEAMNEQARKILGLNSSPVGEPFAHFVKQPELIELTRAPVSRALEFALASGTKVHVRMAPKRGARVGPTDRTAGTGAPGVVLVIEDVTNMRELETVRRDFVANVSHELRTPVAVIRANAETLSAGAKRDPEMASRLIDGLHRNAERLARILADLLDLSRLDAGHYRLDISDVNLRSAVEQAVAAVEPLTKQKHCTINVDVDADLMVRADSKALDQVLVNLIDNAVKYGASPGTVTIGANPNNTSVRIDVCDDGAGLEPAHRKRVFERFYRADSSRSREAGGTGLGLAIVKHLVESMDGEVAVTSAAPHGSIFQVTLPAVR
jgi:two-component system, OmpR family, phosphate regulon sensor histidine kinase PhoR